MTTDFFTQDRLPERPTMYLTVALPRCGKSSWANCMHDRLQATIVARDDIRRAMGVDRFDPKVEPAVTCIETYMIRTLLERGLSVIVDNVSHTVQIRGIYRQLAKEYEARIVAVIFELPREEEWRRRCEATGFSWSVLTRLAEEQERLTDYERRIMCVWSVDNIPEKEI